MPVPEDSKIQTIKDQIETWNDRAAMCRQQGNRDLEKQSLDRKKFYEMQLKLMSHSDTRMPRSLSGKMPVILPVALPLVLFVIAAAHRDHLAMFAVGTLFMVPSCCAIAFCRSDKSAVILFSSAVIALLLLSYFIPITGLFGSD